MCDLHCPAFRVVRNVGISRTIETSSETVVRRDLPAALDLFHCGWVHYSYYYKSELVLELFTVKRSLIRKKLLSGVFGKSTKGVNLRRNWYEIRKSNKNGSLRW